MPLSFQKEDNKGEPTRITIKSSPQQFNLKELSETIPTQVRSPKSAGGIKSYGGPKFPKDAVKNGPKIANKLNNRPLTQ
jgi:hypothetical protein